MSADIESKVRRQAAWATFERHLKPEQRIEALWMLEKSYQKGDMNTLIGYVTKVGERYGFSDDMCKKLYYEYFKLVKSKDDAALPDDPLPLMRRVRQDLLARRQHQQQLSGTASTPRPAVAAAKVAPVRRREKPSARQKASGMPLAERPKYAQSQTTTATATKRAAPVAKKTARRKPEEEPRQVIFNFLMSRMVEYYDGGQDQLFIKMIEKMGEVDLPPEASGQFSSWMSSPQTHHWRSAMSDEALSSLLQLLLLAISDLMGKAEAEQLLRRVVVESNELVEAKEFSADSLL